MQTFTYAGNPTSSQEDLIDIITNEVEKILRVGISSGKPFLKSEFRYPLIPVGVSSRHVHLTQQTFHALFGEAAKFDATRPLFQPGEFATDHTITIVGPRMRSISGLRILGPLRKYDQVELSLTDAIFIGVDPPIVNSGSLENASPLTLVGSNGSVYLEKCAIIPNRHIHSSNREASIFGLKNGDLCKVHLGGEKGVVLENVLIRTSDNWKLQMHLDTDDANAANIREDTYAEFIGKM